MGPQPVTHPRFPFVTHPSGWDAVGEGLRREAEVVRAALPDGTEIWVALSHRLAREVLTNPAFSRSAATEPGAPRVTEGLALPAMLSSLEGEDHTRIRRLLTKAFTPRMVEGMRPWITEVVTDFLDAAEREEPVDLVAALASPLPVRVMCELLGVPFEDRDRFEAWVHTMDAVGDSTDAVLAAFEEFQEYLRALVDRRRQDPGSDLTSELIRVADGTDQLGPEELIGNLLMLLGAGTDTTVCQLASSIAALLGEPERYTLLCSRPELVDGAVEELLRYLLLLPCGAMMRVATRDTELGGWTVRAGEGVAALTYLANRDPGVFTEPDRFDLERADAGRHLSFGAGPHFCVGAQLARMELRIALGELVRRFPKARLAVPEEELRWREGGLMRMPLALPVLLR
ncbi:cytochrome P450 [Streptomyces sp. NPDC057638]|uniref:cytochrome P450 n=1 Tax=Streptomyces sp. NPDC057638 TaxID=3346190 RepID=UPI0036BD79D7